MTASQLDKAERDAFLDWRRALAKCENLLFQNDNFGLLALGFKRMTMSK